jgi:hypothetical protein
MTNPIVVSPCPFCGGAARVGDNDDKEWHADTWWVVCDGCGARGPGHWNGAHRWENSPAPRTDAECQSAAVAAWNTRAFTSTPGAPHAD